MNKYLQFPTDADMLDCKSVWVPNSAVLSRCESQNAMDERFKTFFNTRVNVQLGCGLQRLQSLFGLTLSSHPTFPQTLWVLCLWFVTFVSFEIVFPMTDREMLTSQPIPIKTPRL